MSKRFYTEVFPPTFSSLVKRELDPRFSRQAVEVAPTQSPLPFGLVLSRNEQGQYGPYAAASGQAETAAQAEADSQEAAQFAILLSPLPASETAQTGLVLVGYAVINKNALAWDAGVTDKDAALTGLASQHFVLESVPALEEDGDAA